ncbi:MAG: hypothetical protein JWN50_519 [Parcubacteria group bacterium]|nr:hypothetical protein [Parcubacteria group bacterium]
MPVFMCIYCELVSSMIVYSKMLSNSWRSAVVWIYKGLVVCVVLIIAFFLYQMILTGRANVASNSSALVVAKHRSQAHLVAWTTLLLVLLIETGVRLNGGSERNVWFWIHAAFAVLYTASIAVLVFWYDGTHAYHKALAYVAMGCFLVVACLGVPMLFKRF